MFDPLLSLLAAKAKAVGLIAGTAMVTTALVGGGAVAMTAVSHDGTLHDEVVAPVEEVVTEPVEEVVVPVEEVVTEDVVDGEDAVAPPLPDDFVCDDTKNHGQNVSAYAKSLPKGPGRGAKVSAVAQSDCGKTAAELEEEAEESDEAAVEDTEESEVAVEGTEDADEVEEPAKAEKKAAKKSAKSERKAGKSGGKGKSGK